MSVAAELESVESAICAAAYSLYHIVQRPTRYLDYANEALLYLNENDGIFVDALATAYARRTQAGVMGSDQLVGQ